MTKNVNLKVVERKEETYQRKYAFLKRNNTLIIFSTYPLIFVRGKYLQYDEELTSTKTWSMSPSSTKIEAISNIF